MKMSLVSGAEGNGDLYGLLSNGYKILFLFKEHYFTDNRDEKW